MEVASLTNPNMGRCSIFSVVGGYLIYLAYELARDMINGVPSQMPRALTIIVVILFAGIGVTLIVFAWKFWKEGREGKPEDRVEIPEEESTATDEEHSSEK